MATRQGAVSLLNEPIAQELLKSTTPARLAYVSPDGTPRVVPIWFHWNGKQLVLGTPLKAPKVRAISSNPKVALTIDGTTWPYKVLQIRGTAQVETVAGVVPCAGRRALLWLSARQGVGRAGSGHVSPDGPNRRDPSRVAILDFERRFPSAIEAAMSSK